MKIKPSYSEAESILDHIKNSPHVYGGGAMETLSERINIVTVQLGRLVETLAEKGLLTAPDVTRVANYEDADATFQED